MRLTVLLTVLLLPHAAFAHVGHLGEMGGHDHVVAGIALGAAVGVAIWGWLKGGKDKDAEQAETDADASGQEVEA